jgi:hypothetical protein
MRGHWPNRTRSAFLPRLRIATWGLLAIVGWAAEAAERRNLGPLLVLDTVERPNVSRASLGGILALCGRERNGPGGAVASGEWRVEGQRRRNNLPQRRGERRGRSAEIGVGVGCMGLERWGWVGLPAFAGKGRALPDWRFFGDETGVW